MRGKIFLSLAIFFAGFIVMSVALFADALELDQGAGWGRARIALFSFGIFLALISFLYYIYAERILNALNATKVFFEKYIPMPSSFAFFSKYRFVFPYIVSVILIYIWLVSSGTWITWTSPTYYYANLSKGFQNGNLYTTSKPPAELIALPDPYDDLARHRAGVNPPIDISYYKGRYYLYWGPVPSLLLVVVSPLHYGRIGDLQLVFFFACGIFFVLSFFLFTFYDRFFQHIPKWTLTTSILLAGLSNPSLFMLANFSGARIYEAAVFGAQFFLMAGFLAAFIGLSGSLENWKLALTGVLWALAIGTRQTILLPVAFMALILAYRLANTNRTSSQKITGVVSLVLPLILGLILLGWYNWARFGSVTESGTYYQMNHGFVHYHVDELFGFKYVFQNLYNYFFAPFNVSAQFPFLHPNLGSKEEMFLFSASAPSIYGSQLITGLLYAAPFVIFFTALFFKRQSEAPNAQRLFNWIIATLAGSALAAFSFLLIFFWAAMRYMADFMPSLMLLSVIGFWHGYSLLLQKPLALKLYTALAVTLASVSIVVSLLLALSVNDARFLVIRFFTQP